MIHALKTVMIHGQNHKGSTYQIANMLAKKIGGEVITYFLPDDFGEFCIGCNNCFMKSESACPHFEKLNPISNAIEKADIVILASPVYVYHATGAMKNFLDHYGYQWMVHRPNEAMFKKQGVCISTAAGAGMRSTNKDMSDSMFFWGIGKIYRYGIAVQAIAYKDVSWKIKRKIDKKTTHLARKITNRSQKISPGFKTRLYFYLMRAVMKKGWNQTDVEYWREKGWIAKVRPW